MYPNPFNRKHSTIRQVLDKFLSVDFNNNSNNKKLSAKRDIFRTNSSASSASDGSCRSSTSSLKYPSVWRR